jgi:hypothetical protein
MAAFGGFAVAELLPLSSPAGRPATAAAPPASLQFAL